MHIYKITHVATGRIYVGKTEYPNANDRWVAHKYHAASYNKKDICPKLYNAMRKYGVDAFTFEVIETVASRQDLDSREVFWIAELNSAGTCGFNLTHGGSGGTPTEEALQKMRMARARQKHTTESRAKIGAAHKGRIKSEAERANISAARTGYKMSDAAKEKLRETMKAKWADPTYRLHMRVAHIGNKVAPETRAKLSAALKGKPKRRPPSRDYDFLK